MMRPLRRLGNLRVEYSKRHPLAPRTEAFSKNGSEAHKTLTAQQQ
jgi:hypothetical protein